MGATVIQAAIDFGNSITAQQLGVPYGHYRPQGTGNPLASGNLLGTLPALFTQDIKSTKLPKTKSDEYVGYFDGRLTLPSDTSPTAPGRSSWRPSSRCCPIWSSTAPGSLPSPAPTPGRLPG